MNASSIRPDVQLYALRVATAGPEGRLVLSGCVEHVLSGCRRQFANGDALLALLAEGPAPQPSPGRTTRS